jgi:ribosomal protein L37E
MINKDELIICNRCGSDAAYKQEATANIYTIQCFGCGFCVNSAMKKDTEFFKEQMKLLPDLYKELMVEDENGLIWMPTTINQPQTGMIFANGTSGENWKWAAVKAVPVKEDEKEKFKKKDGTYFEFRMDMETMKLFEEKDFMEALDYLGLLK